MTLPIDSNEAPVFAEPWQARVFALQVSAIDAGLFSASNWADRLGSELSRSVDDDGSHYYHAWLRALEGLLAEIGTVGADDLTALRDQWLEAAARTPHGQPIELGKNSISP